MSDVGLLFRGVDDSYANDAAWKAAFAGGLAAWDQSISDISAGQISLDDSVLYDGHPTIKYAAHATAQDWIVGLVGSSPLRRWVIEAVRFSPTLATSAPIEEGSRINVVAELSNTWNDYDRFADIFLTATAPTQLAGGFVVIGAGDNGPIFPTQPAPAFDRLLADVRGVWLLLARLIEYDSDAAILRMRGFVNGTLIFDTTKAEADYGGLVGMGDLINFFGSAVTLTDPDGTYEFPTLFVDNPNRVADPTNDYVHYGRCDVYDADVNPDPLGVLSPPAAAGATSGKGKRRYWVEVQRDRDGNVVGFITNSPVS